MHRTHDRRMARPHLAKRARTHDDLIARPCVSQPRLESEALEQSNDRIQGLLCRNPLLITKARAHQTAAPHPSRLLKDRSTVRTAVCESIDQDLREHPETIQGTTQRYVGDPI